MTKNVNKRSNPYVCIPDPIHHKHCMFQTDSSDEIAGTFQKPEHSQKNQGASMNPLVYAAPHFNNGPGMIVHIKRRKKRRDLYCAKLNIYCENQKLPLKTRIKKCQTRH